MKLVWTDWINGSAEDGKPSTVDGVAAAKKSTPYVDWYLNNELPPEARDFFEVREQPALRGVLDGKGPWIALPKKALPKGVTEIKAPAKMVLDKAQINNAPEAGDVIIGIIDAGLALSHARFRRSGGKGTRILSYWQQGGTWQGQTHLPFGRGMVQAEIDHLIAQSAGDEAAFNRAAKLVDFVDPMGERWIETEAPHGTFVADLAAGADPDDEKQKDFRDRTHLIMVDLAPRFSIGPSGSFLELYVIWAIRHIVETTEALWALYGDGSAAGFPIVINLSYGLEAGPKDGSMIVQKEIRRIQKERKAAGRLPLHIILPAGNDNLERGAAVLHLGAKEQALPWRVLPEDRTSSYAEVWTDVIPGDGEGQDTHPFVISLTTPDGVAGPGSAGPVGHHCDLVDLDSADPKRPLARIYSRRTNDSDGTETAEDKPLHRFVYVICVAPTWSATRPAAPSGQWMVSLQGDGTALLYVQSDQNVVPGAGTGLLSYFECDSYVRHEADGRLRDTYWKDPVTQAISDVDGAGPIHRNNTLNAIAGSAGTVTVGGYRASDGWPADYSASSRGVPRGGQPLDGDPYPKGGNALVDLAAVSDDGIWRAGRLAAGSRSGSAVVMQGTSFATAEATRIMVEQLLAGTGEELVVLDKAETAAKQYDPASALELKLGAGRLDRRDHGRVAR